jgi:VCBS repeat-containing protein
LFNCKFTFMREGLAHGDNITRDLTTAPQGATINAQTGVIIWSPTAAGSYSFNVSASDGKGDTIARINVLANDTDAEGNPLTTTVVTGPLHGTLVKNADGSFSYTPHKDWYGTDSFTYTANDGKANSNLATVTLTVKPVNDAPVANNAAYTLQKDGSIKIDLRSLTSDVDGNCLTLCVSNPGKGTLTKNADGTYTYRPRAGYTGADSFSYTVSDGKLTSTGSISLNVRASQRDDDEDDHCHGNNSHNGNGNSHHNRSASVTVTSSASSSSSCNSRSNEEDRDIHYVVINSANSQATSQSTAPASSASSNALAVNWQAGSTSQAIAASPPSQGNSWLNQLLSTDSKNDKNDLSQKTGLKVKL